MRDRHTDTCSDFHPPKSLAVADLNGFDLTPSWLPLEGLEKTMKYTISAWQHKKYGTWAGCILCLYVSVYFGGRNSQLLPFNSLTIPEYERHLQKLEHQCVLSPPTFLIKMFLLKGKRRAADSNIYMDHHPTDKFCAFQLS